MKKNKWAIADFGRALKFSEKSCKVRECAREVLKAVLEVLQGKVRYSLKLGSRFRSFAEGGKIR